MTYRRRIRTRRKIVTQIHQNMFLACELYAAYSPLISLTLTANATTCRTTDEIEVT